MFGPRTDFPVGVNPGTVVTGDFNRDGRLDLAVSNRGTLSVAGDVSLLYGNGDGTFNVQPQLSTTRGPMGLAVADFNRDGKPDLAAANTDLSRVTIFLNAPPATNTPVGSSVAVTVVDATTGTTSADVLFANVSQAGTTTLSITSGGPTPPTGFKLGNPPIYFGLQTTASFTGQVEVCIDYSGIGFGSPSSLKLFHHENDAWVDITTSLDTTDNIICGSVTSFSAFGVFEPEVINQPPTARGGPDQTVECCGTAGTQITLDGSASSDPDGDTLSFEWRDAAGNVVGSTAVVNLALTLGTHSFTLTVNDGKGGASSESVLVTVQDTTPPSPALALSPNVFWPPDHRLVGVTATIQVTDICDASPTVELASITSNEPDNGLGDGDTASDIQGASFGTDDRSFFLRAERSGPGTGRIYTVRYRVRDASGNVAVATAQVTVPHNQQ